MKLVLTILLVTLLASQANAQARYMPAENAYHYSNGASYNPQPTRVEPTRNYRLERAPLPRFNTQARVPVYREAIYREARIAIPREIRVNMNPAGRMPR